MIRKDVSLYSPEGLKKLAEMLEARCVELYEKRRLTQKAIGDMCGVSGNVISDLRRNIQPHPDPRSILKLEGLIPKNDGSGEFYTGLDLLAIACNFKETPVRREEGDENEYDGPNQEAVLWLRQKLGSEAIASVSERCNVPEETLKELLNGADPSWRDMLFLSACMNCSAEEILRLYGIDPDAPPIREKSNSSETKPKRKGRKRNPK